MCQSHTALLYKALVSMVQKRLPLFHIAPALVEFNEDVFVDDDGTLCLVPPDGLGLEFWRHFEGGGMPLQKLLLVVF